MSVLIAEVGNNHFGSITKFKEMIRIAKECGAHMVKGQAMNGKPLGGSMPESFYNDVSLNPREYIEAIDYGNEIGIPVFYSIFDEELQWLMMHQYTHKIAASQLMDVEVYATIDRENILVSVNDAFLDSGRLKFFKPKLCGLMYASPYLDMAVNLSKISTIATATGRLCGYSDHTVGVRACMDAREKYGVQIIEKHFTLDRDFNYGGHVFRDTIHAALPYELDKIAGKMQ